jgi:hypothetical protein
MTILLMIRSFRKSEQGNDRGRRHALHSLRSTLCKGRSRETRQPGYLQRGTSLTKVVGRVTMSRSLTSELRPSISS